MTVKTYDSKSRDLAERFLDDYDLDDKQRRELAHALAIEIQEAVESFIDFRTFIDGQPLKIKERTC